MEGQTSGEELVGGRVSGEKEESRLSQKRGPEEHTPDFAEKHTRARTSPTLVFFFFTPFFPQIIDTELFYFSLFL